jgi:hypothetical protein
MAQLPILPHCGLALSMAGPPIEISLLGYLGLISLGTPKLNLKTEYQLLRWAWTQSKHDLELRSCGPDALPVMHIIMA